MKKNLLNGGHLCGGMSTVGAWEREKKNAAHSTAKRCTFFSGLRLRLSARVCECVRCDSDSMHRHGYPQQISPITFTFHRKKFSLSLNGRHQQFIDRYTHRTPGGEALKHVLAYYAPEDSPRFFPWSSSMQFLLVRPQCWETSAQPLQITRHRREVQIGYGCRKFSISFISAEQIGSLSFPVQLV